MDAIIQPARLENENRAMCDLIDRYKGQTAIFRADRGYESYNVLAHAERKNMYYLIRINRKIKNITKGSESLRFPKKYPKIFIFELLRQYPSNHSPFCLRMILFIYFQVIFLNHKGSKFYRCSA